MKRKTFVFIVLTMLLLTLGSCRHGLRQTLTNIASELGNVVPNEQAEATEESSAGDSASVPELRQKGDSAVVSPLEVPVSSEKDEPQDSIRAKKEAQDSILPRNDDEIIAETPKIEVDTTAMDSLELAVYRHNRAIDDSIRLDSLNRRRKNGIDSPVEYVANDSIVYYAGSKMAYLYGQSNVKYQNMDLKSEQIHMNMDSSLVYSTGVADSLGKLTGTPVFQIGSDTYENDTMSFNFKSKKGLIKNVYTQQEDGFLFSEVSKRMDSEIGRASCRERV